MSGNATTADVARTDAATADVMTAERTSQRERPPGWPIIYQTWDRLLFLHWPVDADCLRRMIPPGLELDTWDGTAWIGVTPFTIRGVRPPLIPSLPVLSTSHELNVRTYVHHNGVPGVWFLSLDASNPLAVWAARLGYFLPYFHANMKLEAGGQRTEFRSLRNDRKGTPAGFHAAWHVGVRLPDAAPGTREFFLIERYCLYASRRDQLYRARIHHQPWPLAQARLERLCSSVIKSHGLPEPQQDPLVHALADPLHVAIWPLERVS